MQNEVIKVDFFADVVQGMARQLVAWAHPVPSGTGTRDHAAMQEIAMLYLNVERRRIVLRPRTVHVGASLQCPASVEAGYQAVLEKARKGDDLNPHLSRSIASDAGYNDQLLNDWGLHHLHLGLATEADGFIERTDELAFAVVRPKEMFVVAIGVHGEWTARRLLDTVDANWPHLLDGCRVPIFGPPASGWSEKNHLKARKKNVLAVSTLSTGEPILAPGGGYASSGLSVDISRRLVSILDQTRQLEEWFQTLAPAILEHLAAQGSTAAPPDFHLEPLPNGGYAAVDVRNAIQAVLYDPDQPN